MVGRKKDYFRDRILLLLYSFIGLIALVFYVLILQSSNNFFLFVYFAGGAFLYFKRKAVRLWLLKIIRYGFSFLKKYIFTILSHVPTVIWGAFAVIGIFLVGVLVGSATPEQSTATAQESKKELEYRQVIDGYQDISKLFYMQQQDMDIVTNMSAWQNNPEELSDAIYSYRQKKDEILFHWGRLYELRKKAGLSDDIYFKSN